MKEATPESWKNILELFVMFDKDDDVQIMDFYVTGCGYYAA